MSGDGARGRGEAGRSGDPAGGGVPEPAPACPACRHRHTHTPDCDLAALPVRDAAALGHRAALEYLRARADGDYPLAPPAPAPPAYGFPPPPTVPACPACHHAHRHAPGCPLTPLPPADAAALGQGDEGVPATPPGSAPPRADACPACHHTRRHQWGCVLEPLPVRDAAVLGYDAALGRVHALRAPAPATGAPPAADACPGCHHTRRHEPGCELAALTVAEAAALDLLRVRAAGDGDDPHPAPGAGWRGWLRRLRR